MTLIKYGRGEVFYRLLKSLFKRWPLLAASTLTVIIYAYTVSLGPVFLRYAVDEGVSKGDLSSALTYALIILGLTAFGGVMWFATRYLTALLSQDLAHDLRVKAFSAIHRQSMEFFDRMATGQLISRVTNDTNRLARAVAWQVRNIVNLSFTAGISLYYMFTMNQGLSYIVLASMALMSFLNTKYALSIRPLYDKIRNQLGVLASIVTSNLNGIKTVKALTLEEREIAKFSEENEVFTQLNLRAAKVRAIYGNASQLVLGGAMATVLYYGAYAISAGSLSVGELTAFITYLTLLMWPMRAFGFMLSSLQRALAAAQRVYEIIDSSSNEEGVGSLPSPSIAGELEFKKVTFHYLPGKPVLKDVSFKVRPGEKIFLAGPPGSGKSTILKLILRFYEPQEGEILIDGKDIRDYDPVTLRESIAYVPQEPFIFSGTLKENIPFGNLNARMEDVIEVAKAAKIHDFISSLPEGYDTLVGERGVTLSGGQRQRVAIARALLKKPRIVLLDDPVSNLDAKTEEELLKDLADLLKGRTTIITGQRPSLARLADRIIVLDRGEIVE
jgi:ATP-binding cassette subfamily B protein